MAPPTFDDIRDAAYRMLVDAENELSIDWAPGNGPTVPQADAARRALAAIQRAKAALREAR